MQGRLFERDIFTEKFLTSADGANAAARTLTDSRGVSG